MEAELCNLMKNFESFCNEGEIDWAWEFTAESVGAETTEEFTLKRAHPEYAEYFSEYSFIIRQLNSLAELEKEASSWLRSEVAVPSSTRQKELEAAVADFVPSLAHEVEASYGSSLLIAGFSLSNSWVRKALYVPNLSPYGLQYLIMSPRRACILTFTGSD